MRCGRSLAVKCLNACWLRKERGAQRLELTGASKLAEDSMRCPPLGGDGCFEATGGEELDVRIARAQLLQQLDIDADES